MEKIEHALSISDIHPFALLEKHGVYVDHTELTPAILEEFKSALGVFAEAFAETNDDELKLYIALWRAIVADERDHTHNIQEIYDATTGKHGLHNLAEAIEELLGWLNKPHLLTYESTHVL